MIPRTLSRLGALAAILSLAGCVLYSAPVRPPAGVIYQNTSSPMDTDADGLGVGTKSGSASVTSIMGLFSWGDCSLESAAAAGGISTVNQVDYELFHVLGIYQKFTTVTEFLHRRTAMLKRTVCTRLLSIGVLALTAGCTAGAPLSSAGLDSVSVGPAGILHSTFPSVPVTPPQGLLYSHYKAPLSPDAEGIALGSKTGRSSTLFLQLPAGFIGLPNLSTSFGDASIAEAMQDGGITTLTHLDYEVTTVLAVFGEFTVIAHGN